MIMSIKRIKLRYPILLLLFPVWVSVTSMRACAVEQTQLAGLLSLIEFMEIPVDAGKVQKAISAAQMHNQVTALSIADSATNLGLRLKVRQLSVDDLKQWRGPALIHLRTPDRFTLLTAISSQYAFLDEQVIPIQDLKSRYTGEALVIDAAQSAARIDDPIRVRKVQGAADGMSEQITIINQGKGPLQLWVERVSCGCTVAALSTGALASGQSATLRVKMSGSGWGEKTETVTLRTSDPAWPHILIVLQEELPYNIVLNPAQLTVNAQQGKAETRLATLLLPQTAAITKIKTDSPYILAAVTESKPITDGKLQRVEITISEKAPIKLSGGQVVFMLSNAQVPFVSLPVIVTINPDVVAVPGRIFLDQLQSGSVTHKTVMVTSQSGHPFSIESVTSDSGAITAEVEKTVIAAAHSIEFSAKFTGTAGSVVKDTVTIKLSDGVTLNLPVVGMIARPDKTSTPPNK